MWLVKGVPSEGKSLYSHKCNEGTKVQNPQRHCHVIIIANIHVYTWQYAYIRGQMRECTGKYTEIWQRQKLAAYAERYLRHCLTHRSPFE